jgi:ubiquinone/menaquinone biosynthesis C-methylase UbiE
MMSEPQEMNANDGLGNPPSLTPAMRQRSFERMHLKPGQCVLDAGCGTGLDTLALACEVGAGGVVHGVDYDAAMIARAWQHTHVRTAPAGANFHHANATALPWPDDYFDASRSDRILQQMLDAERGFEEQLRVTRPGGRVVVISGDWSTLLIDSDDPDIEGRRAYFMATLLPDNAMSGQCLQRLFSDKGLLDIVTDVMPLFRVTVAATGRVSDTEANACWQQSCTANAAFQGHFASANVVIVSGRKAHDGGYDSR